MIWLLQLVKFDFQNNIGGQDINTQYGANNFATIRTPSIVKKQKVEQAQDDLFKEQMSGYKKMRKQHQRELHQVSDCIHSLSACTPNLVQLLASTISGMAPLSLLMWNLSTSTSVSCARVYQDDFWSFFLIRL